MKITTIGAKNVLNNLALGREVYCADFKKIEMFQCSSKTVASLQKYIAMEGSVLFYIIEEEDNG